MNWASCAITVFALSILVSASKSVIYDGYKVFRVNPSDSQQRELLKTIEGGKKYDFWTDVRKIGPVDIMVSPQEQDDLLELLNGHGLTHNVMIEDVQALIEESKMTAGNTISLQGHNMDWDSYHPLEDMYGYFDFLEGMKTKGAYFWKSFCTDL